jgi:hypothetical protein
MPQTLDAQDFSRVDVARRRGTCTAVSVLLEVDELIERALFVDRPSEDKHVNLPPYANL